MKQFFRLLLLTPLLFMLPLGAAEAEAPVKAEIYAEETAVQAGRPFWLAVKLDIEGGWHAYWKNPGMSGFASSVEWSVPNGYQIDESLWPTPERMEMTDGVVYGYHDTLTLLTKVTPPKNLQAGDRIDIQADLNWLVCSDTTCLPGKAPLKLTLEVTDSTPAADSKSASLFAEARSKLPTQAPEIEAKASGSAIELKLPKHSRSFEHAHFYAEITDLIDDAQKVIVSTMPDHHIFKLPVRDTAESSGSMVKGLLVLEDGQGEPVESIEINAPINQGENNTFQFQGGFFWALALAFAGGLILNLMPCVLPVISLKIFSFVKMAGENRFKIVSHGLLFTLGVLASFWVLAAVLISLQAYGQMVGWGFQLQEPIFVALLAALIFVFGLSLFGLFEVGTMFSSWAGQKESDARQKGGGAAGAFFSGVLATAVATPCTGPFLGSALGFAMTLSAPLSLMIFTAIALGMSFPYLLISAFPSLIRFLPKPGKWMVTFKEILGFCMLATTLWLIWVFGAQTGYDALFTLLTAFMILAAACWIYGKWGAPSRKRWVRISAIAFAFLIGSFGIYEVVQSSWMDAPPEELIAMADIPRAERNIRSWEPFSVERLEELKSEGRPVFIDFTAKWCLICQTNHRVVESPEVSEKLAELGVVKMLADWTKKNPEISRELQKFGRNGVPLYVLYDKNGKAVILPQLLTPETVLEYLKSIE